MARAGHGSAEQVVENKQAFDKGLALPLEVHFDLPIGDLRWRSTTH